MEKRGDIEMLREALGEEFQIVRELGRGSVATVYLAREGSLDRPVAIKVLNRARDSEESLQRRFDREAKAVASLSHPNVVQAYRFGRLPDDRPYLVMRFVRGRTLEERLKAEGRFPLDLAIRILREVASALAEAHASGIVHRDVRPGNVLWDEEKEQTLLSDFGIAAIVAADEEEATRFTKPGEILGDPRYMSPEQLRANEVTELTDIYQFGLLGYELLTGEGPYTATTAHQWLVAHLNQKPGDLRARRPDVDARLADLLLRCLNRNPKHRPRATDIVRILGEMTSRPAPEDAGGVAAVADFQQLLRRRVPQVILFAGGVGLGLMSLMNELTADQGMLDVIWYRLTLPFVACGVAAVTVIAWFHGEKGSQQTIVLEWILLSVIGVIWIMANAWILMHR